MPSDQFAGFANRAGRDYPIGFATDPIELDVTSGSPVTIPHGLGRQIAGYLVIWQTVSTGFTVTDPDADSSKELVLTPDATGKVRLVLM